MQQERRVHDDLLQRRPLEKRLEVTTGREKDIQDAEPWRTGRADSGPAEDPWR